MRITSQKELIRKMEEGYRLWYYQPYKTAHYYLCKETDEINVSPSIVRKLKDKGIIDENFQLNYKPKT